MNKQAVFIKAMMDEITKLAAASNMDPKRTAMLKSMLYDMFLKNRG
jgi:hypothetical protein